MTKSLFPVSNFIRFNLVYYINKHLEEFKYNSSFYEIFLIDNYIVCNVYFQLTREEYGIVTNIIRGSIRTNNDEMLYFYYYMLNGNEHLKPKLIFYEST